MSLLGLIIAYNVGKSSGEASTQAQQDRVLQSSVAGRDVILCREREKNTCLSPDSYHHISPEQYAGDCGYRTIYSKAILIRFVPSIGDEVYIVMEVSR